jgi:hypothetical protein
MDNFLLEKVHCQLEKSFFPRRTENFCKQLYNFHRIMANSDKQKHISCGKYIFPVGKDIFPMEKTFFPLEKHNFQQEMNRFSLKIMPIALAFNPSYCSFPSSSTEMM